MSIAIVSTTSGTVQRRPLSRPEEERLAEEPIVSFEIVRDAIGGALGYHKTVSDESWCRVLSDPFTERPGT